MRVVQSWLPQSWMRRRQRGNFRLPRIASKKRSLFILLVSLSILHILWERFTTSIPLGVVVILAPPRRATSELWHEIPRFCLLQRAIQSVDQFLNTDWGPYPIHVLLEEKMEDGIYASQDRALLRSLAPHSQVSFVPVNLYDTDGVPLETIRQWRLGKLGGIAGRDIGYTAMCRFWSGPLQQQLQHYFEYYMRMDDDSLLTRKLDWDPFERMQSHNLVYAFRRDAADHWGIDKLWEVAKPHVIVDQSMTAASNKNLYFLDSEGVYNGRQPYNNFHISKLSFWKSARWQALWHDMAAAHLAHKYRVGDANVHAMALLMMSPDEWERWTDFPYVHNSNDDPAWGSNAKIWKEECRLREEQFAAASAAQFPFYLRD